MGKASTPYAGKEAADAFISTVCPAAYPVTDTLPDAAVVVDLVRHRREFDGT
jgi:hypothetical protein